MLFILFIDKDINHLNNTLSNILANILKETRELILSHLFLTVCSYHVTYAFQSESTLYNCLNVKEPLAQSMREI